MPGPVSKRDIYDSGQINFMRECFEMSTESLVTEHKVYSIDDLLLTVFNLYKDGIRDQKYLTSLAVQLVSSRRQDGKIYRLPASANKNR